MNKFVTFSISTHVNISANISGDHSIMQPLHSFDVKSNTFFLCIRLDINIIVRLIAQLIPTHGDSHKYMKRIGRTDSDLCRCCEEEANVRPVGKNARN